MQASSRHINYTFNLILNNTLKLSHGLFTFIQFLTYEYSFLNLIFSKTSFSHVEVFILNCRHDTNNCFYGKMNIRILFILDNILIFGCIALFSWLTFKEGYNLNQNSKSMQFFLTINFSEKFYCLQIHVLKYFHFCCIATQSSEWNRNVLTIFKSIAYTRGPWWPWSRSPVYRPPERGQFKPQSFYLNKLGRHPLEDVSC
jgi:hypothetical protein